MPTELKPCPFCGGEATRHPNDPGLVACPDPECAQSMYYVTVGSWNTRAPTPEREALGEIMAAMVKPVMERGHAVKNQWLSRPEVEAILARHGIQLPAEEGSDA